MRFDKTVYRKHETATDIGHEVSSVINFSRFKDRLLTAVPNLGAHVNGKEVFLTYKNDFGTAIKFAYEK